MNENRKQKIVRGFNNDGFEFKGVKYKPLSLRTLALLEDVKSPFITGGGQIRALLDFMFISSHETKDIIQIIESNTWIENVLTYGEQFTQEDLDEMGKLVASQTETAGAAIVEVRDEANKKK